LELKRETRAAEGTRFSIVSGGNEFARAYLYVMHNDLHDEPFGLLEDVYVDESQRGSGVGTRLVQEVIAAAQDAYVAGRDV
jgi:GNAT superfamily N-acetyltransferase